MLRPHRPCASSSTSWASAPSPGSSTCSRAGLGKGCSTQAKARGPARASTPPPVGHKHRRSAYGLALVLSWLALLLTQAHGGPHPLPQSATLIPQQALMHWVLI